MHASSFLGNNSSSKTHVHHLKSLRQLFKWLGATGYFVGVWACVMEVERTQRAFTLTWV